MIIHQKQKRVYRGSGLVWVDDGEPDVMTPEQLYYHWLPDVGSYVFAEIDDDCSGTVALQMCNYKRATILTDDIDSVRVVNQKWREEFIHRDHQYKHSFTGSAP